MSPIVDAIVAPAFSGKSSAVSAGAPALDVADAPTASDTEEARAARDWKRFDSLWHRDIRTWLEGQQRQLPLLVPADDLAAALDLRVIARVLIPELTYLQRSVALLRDPEQGPEETWRQLILAQVGRIAVLERGASDSVPVFTSVEAALELASSAEPSTPETPLAQDPLAPEHPVTRRYAIVAPQLSGKTMFIQRHGGNLSPPAYDVDDLVEPSFVEPDEPVSGEYIEKLRQAVFMLPQPCVVLVHDVNLAAMVGLTPLAAVTLPQSEFDRRARSADPRRVALGRWVRDDLAAALSTTRWAHLFRARSVEEAYRHVKWLYSRIDLTTWLREPEAEVSVLMSDHAASKALT